MSLILKENFLIGLSKKGTIKMVERNKPFVFNNAVNKNRINERNKLVTLNKFIREKLTNISKCVLYSTDKDATSIVQIPPQQQREYAVLVVFDSDNNPNKFDLNIKVTQGTLSLNKYKVLGSKKFNSNDGSVCKMVVKLM